MDKEVIMVDENIHRESKIKFNYMKLFSSKWLKIIVLIMLGIVGIVLFFVSGEENETSKTQVSTKYDYLSTMEYCASLEKKLEGVLSQIKGAGEVRVMISVDGSPEIVYAVDSNSKVSSNTSGSTTTSSSSPIIVQSGSKSEPLILTENLPIVKGVIVVSSGASDIGIKLDIINAVSTLLDISTEKISVLKGE